MTDYISPQALWAIADTIAYWLYAALVLAVVVSVVLNNRSPMRTMAWVMVLIFLPAVGLVLYFFLGRDHRKQRLISRRSLSLLARKTLVNYEARPPVEVPHDCERITDFLKKTALSFPFDGNEVQVFTDAPRMLCALLRAIAAARSHVHVQFYIFADDAAGRMVRDALADCAARGVEVRLLYDDVGCWTVPARFFDEMRASGIDARAFFKVRYPLFTSKVNYRNHRKMVVIDGCVGFVGGMNVAERYVYGPKGGGCWRDTHLMLRGAAVYGLQSSFLADWYFTDGSLITSKKYYPPVAPVADGALVQIATSQPIGEWHEIMRALMLAFTRSQRYLYIQTPYFLPEEELLGTLQSVALSGVDVRLMIPRKSDSIFTQLATSSYLGHVLRAGVKVYLYEPGFLHSKMVVSDDLFSTVGSTNLDFRSLEHNFEVNAFIYNRSVAVRLRKIFLADQKCCRRLTLPAYRRRSKWQRLCESLVRLFAPLL